MPVSEISKGVFIVTPSDLPKYKDTAAGQYTSVFTKQRADQWEMAQKQALLELDLGSKRYAEEMKAYRDRVSALNDRVKQLEGLKIEVAEGRLRAQDAAEIAAMREAGDRQKTAADFAAKKAEVITVSPGSTTTRTGGGGGGGGTKPTADVSTSAMSGIAKYELTTRGQTLDQKMAALARETNPGGTIPTESESDRVNARGSVADRAVAARAAELEKLGQTPAKARSNAQDEVIAALKVADPSAAAEVENYFDVVKPATGPTAGGGGGTTTTTRPADVTTLKRPGLREVPAIVGVTAPTQASAKDLTGEGGLIPSEIARLQALIDAQRAPSMGIPDYITRSREVMRGRFGGFSGAPEALPFEQRNAAERLLTDQAYGLSQVEAYRDFLAKQRAEAATAGRLRESMAEGPATTSVEALRGSPAAQADLTAAAANDILSGEGRQPTFLEGLVAPKTPQIPEISALNIPRKPELTEPPAAAPVPTPPPAPVTPPSPPPPVPEVIPVPQADIRPEAADLMTPAERADYYARLRASADARQLIKDVAAVDTGGSEINPDFRTPLSPPSALPRPALPIMEAPQQVAAPFDPQFAVPRTPAGFRPSLGTKEEGPLVVASPAMAPSTSGAAPRGPADISAAVRPAGPLAGQFPTELKAKTERFAKSTEMAEDVRKATKSGIGTVGSQFGIKKGGPPTAVGYFQNRAEVALELIDKRSKLDRISNSGPGKLAKDIYMANSKDGKPFETTWQEIQLAFAGDPKGREAAHEVALALDIINRDEKAAPKQTPK
jgi:hypothetical protein